MQSYGEGAAAHTRCGSAHTRCGSKSRTNGFGQSCRERAQGSGVSSFLACVAALRCCVSIISTVTKKNVGAIRFEVKSEKNRASIASYKRHRSSSSKIPPIPLNASPFIVHLKHLRPHPIPGHSHPILQSPPSNLPLSPDKKM